MNEKIRLEYSQKQACFHFETDVLKQTQNTNGYFTVDSYIERDIATRFTKLMWNKYPILNIPIQEMKDEWAIFMLDAGKYLN